jgi:hypothetical protein
MSMDRKIRKADQTGSSTAMDPVDRQDPAKVPVKSTKAGEATPSRKPAAIEDTSSERENDEEEYILDREPDGRYRIVGRRPRKQK